jgi:hypothetical protein
MEYCSISQVKYKPEYPSIDAFLNSTVEGTTFNLSLPKEKLVDIWQEFLTYCSR